MFVIMAVFSAVPAFAGPVRELTLDTAVAIAMRNSYSIRKLELEIQSRLSWLKAQRAGMKSKVYADLVSPNIRNVSDYKWNSSTFRDELVRQNTMLWQGGLSVDQPVILFDYPTNGYVSLNYMLNRYQQFDEGYSSTDYYNRLFLKYEQPLFVPNRLKNDIMEAELNLEESRLRAISERGTKTDAGDSYARQRAYFLNPSLIRPGKINVIAVRVWDRGGGGGIYAGPVGLVVREEYLRYEQSRAKR